ncbi:tape measure protein [Gemella sanguinis]|uniref:tape measure protein n=1 Tax=Gemella sanguinis TaxID=84135 RepID=UPI0028D61761|nr:tape measure protein [Gemella sanguinis]
MAEQYSVEAVLSAVDKGFGNALDMINDKLDKFDNKVGKTESSGSKLGSTFKAMALANLAANAVTKVTGDLNSLVSESIKASDAMDKFRSTMKFAGLDNSAIEKSAAAVKKYADDTVYDLDVVANTTAQLAANGIKDYDGLTQAAGNLNAVAGGNADTFKSVAMVMTQTASAGKLTGENWRQLSDAIPGASGKIQEALKKNGAYTGDFRKALEQGKISADEFNQAIMDLGMTDVAKEAATSTKTIEGAIGNMKAGIVTSIMEIIDAIGKDRITGAITALGTFITNGLGLLKIIIPPVISALTWLFDLINRNQAIVSAMAGAFIGFKAALAIEKGINAVSAALNAFKAAQKAATLAQAALNAVMAINPFTIIVLAISALVALLIYFWHTNEGFRNAVKAIWDGIKAAFVQAWEAIKAAWTGAAEFFSGIWSGIKSGVQGIVQWIAQTWSGAVAVLKVVWDSISNAATTAWNFIIQSIMSVVQPFINTFVSGWNILKDGINGVWNGIKSIFKGAWEFIKSVVLGAALLIIDVVSGNFSKLKADLQLIWDGIKNAFSSVWNGIKTIAVTVVTTLVNLVRNAWEGLKQVLTTIWNILKTSATTIWDGLKSAVLSITSALVNTAKSVWEGFKNFFYSLLNGVRNTAVNSWNSIRSSVVSIISGLVGAAQNAWYSFRNGVSNLVSSVSNIFYSLRNINLWNAGSAIINGFLNGLRSAWGSVRNFVSGIADWIRDNKGPISYDRKLLIPAGNVIMGGFNEGLENGFKNTMSKIEGITGNIQSRFNINQSKALNVESNYQGQSLNINFKLGDRAFKGFVEDINDLNGEMVQLEETYAL